MDFAAKFDSYAKDIYIKDNRKIKGELVGRRNSVMVSLGNRAMHIRICRKNRMVSKCIVVIVIIEPMISRSINRCLNI